MSNIKLFDVRHWNDKHQNELNVKPFGVEHSTVECQVTNIKPTSAKLTSEYVYLGPNEQSKNINYNLKCTF